jgi:hypothetical protein
MMGGRVQGTEILLERGLPEAVIPVSIKVILYHFHLSFSNQELAELSGHDTCMVRIFST